jgi:hypothetical protein
VPANCGKKRVRLPFITATAAVLFSAAPALATTSSFLTAGDPYSVRGSSGVLGDTGISSPSMWTAGDYVTHTITDTGLTSINSLSYSYSVYNALYNGGTETIEFLINGIQVDTHTYTSGIPGTATATDTVNFSPIIGNGTYALTLEVMNSVSKGSIAFYEGGTVDLESKAVPEPATATLLAGSLLVLPRLRRRR